MKLIYIYFDFTDNGEHPEGYRGFKKCGFNFGTKEYFKMEEPTHEHPNYILSCVPRPEDEQIEPGFWGDERLYNISALVGDNGVGKSTIIQEIIRCVISGSEYAKTITMQTYRNFNMCVSVWKETDNTYRIFGAPENVRWTGFVVSPNNQRTYISPDSHPILDKTKLIYFSNTLSECDRQLLFDLGSAFFYPHLSEGMINPYYTGPFYNCSLSADIAEAIKISRIQPATVAQSLDIYFNFRSYQEARYVFDRNQRLILSELKNNQLPVPFPRSLSIQILPARERFAQKFFSRNDTQADKNLSIGYQQFIAQYNQHLSNSPFTDIIISELCLNCISSFYQPERNERRINIPHTFLRSYGTKEFYINLLSLIHNSKNSISEDVFYEDCKNYIEFLWNNKSLIQEFFIPVHGELGEILIYGNWEVQIPLGEKIDSILNEFMVRFINLNRAISRNKYFIIYKWGLSSGESNLLHLFTKLRYLLLGNIYDDTSSTDQITREIAEKNVVIPRDEYLLNYSEELQLNSSRNGLVTNYRENKCDSVIIFFDEADLTLHPEWQRQFVSILAAYLPMLYKDPYYEGSESSGCKDIQIILSTHSPIMLGDFPSVSVIYLKKDENGITVNDQSTLNTFGQNIYTILKEGFYLGKGTVGELARRKIKAVMKDLGEIQNPDTRKNETTDEWKRRLEKHQKQTIRHLPKGIIRNKLEEEIAKCKVILGEKPENVNPDVHLLMQTNKELLEENIRLQKQLDELKNKGQKHD